MSNIEKFAILGSRSFNNYYVMKEYLDKYLPRYATIITGHAAGADQMAEVYAQCNKIPLEVYEANWEIFGTDAVMRQRRDIVNNATQCIAFWDGRSAGTKCLIDMFNKAMKTVTIVDITEEDMIKMDPMVVHVNHDPFDVYIGRGHNSPFGNPFKISSVNTRTVVLSMYTDYILSTPALLEQIIALDGKRLGCWCHNEVLCHGDVIYWLLRHEKQKLQDIVDKWKHKDTPTKVQPISTKQVVDILKDWGEGGSDKEVQTSLNTTFAYGYNRIVMDQYNNYYMEFTREQLIRGTVHRMMDDLQSDTEDEDKTNLRYRVNDKSKTEVIFRQKEFSGDDMKSGRWYAKLIPTEGEYKYNIHTR